MAMLAWRHLRCCPRGRQRADAAALAAAPLPSARRQGRFDELVEAHGVKVLIDPGALMHVLGTRMDWVEDRLK